MYPGVLTVQVTLSDPLHVFSMNELITSLPHDVHRGQVHVVADPETQKINKVIDNVSFFFFQKYEEVWSKDFLSIFWNIYSWFFVQIT